MRRGCSENAVGVCCVDGIERVKKQKCWEGDWGLSARRLEMKPEHFAWVNHDRAEYLQ